MRLEAALVNNLNFTADSKFKISRTPTSKQKKSQQMSQLDSDNNRVTGLHNSYPLVIAVLNVLLEVVYL